MAATNRSDLERAPEERSDGNFFPPGCAVRFVRPTDSESVRQLFIETQNALVNAGTDLEVRITHKKLTDAALMDDLKRASIYYSEPGRRMWVVESQEHAIVGFAAIDSDPEEMSEPAVLRRLCVDSAYRRKGVARLLIARAEQWALKQGFSAIQLEISGLQSVARDLFDSLKYSDADSYSFGPVELVRLHKRLERAAA